MLQFLLSINVVHFLTDNSLYNPLSIKITIMHPIVILMLRGFYRVISQEMYNIYTYNEL
jgi:hypothetical protein